MVLLVDVGNSNICFGLTEDGQIHHNFRLKTALDKSYDEYYLLIKEFVKDSFDDVIISSVVPKITSVLVKLFKKYYNLDAKVIGNKLKIGINILADDPKSVGADLIADVAGALTIADEGIIIDLGTASKFLYFKNKSLCGVVIAPGVVVSMNTLTSSTALLPNIELVAPKKVLNNSTIPCMQSGVIYGYASLVDGMINRIKKEVNNDNLKVIATGGLISLISSYCLEKIDVIDDLLTLKGIYEIYKRNI